MGTGYRSATPLSASAACEKDGLYYRIIADYARGRQWLDSHSEVILYVLLVFPVVRVQRLRTETYVVQPLILATTSK